MDTVTLASFILISAIGIATPGPDVLLAMHNGVRYGVGPASLGIIGVLASDALVMGAVALGVGSLLQQFPEAFLAIKVLGALYLAYIGVALLRTAPSALAVPRIDGRTGLAVIGRAFVVALTNVKAWLFFIAFLPQFVQPDQPVVPQYMMLLLVFEAVSVPILFGYLLFGSVARNLLSATVACWMDRASGMALVALAGSLALVQQPAMP